MTLLQVLIKICNLFWLCLSLSIVVGCGGAHRGSITKSPISWEEILETKRTSDRSTPEKLSTSVSSRASSTQSLRSQSSDDNLVRWAQHLKIQKPREFEGGVYGKVGDATVYIAPQEKVPDYDRLHWVMIKVLSEKYGCFVVKKVKVNDTISVACRDRRRVVFRRSRGPEWIMFYGRQYDVAGNEVIISAR
jgi:hypothetical protein